MIEYKIQIEYEKQRMAGQVGFLAGYWKSKDRLMDV